MTQEKPEPGKTDDCVVIYTDGGCVPNPGTGGWAVVLTYKGTTRELSGGENNTTNNRMEITAALEALKALKRPCSVRLYTDSQYLQKGITEWLPKWKANGWKRKKAEVKNLDLWKELDIMTEKHDIEWRWVRGHSGNPLNERCDMLANQEIMKRNPKAFDHTSMWLRKERNHSVEESQ